MAKRSGNLATSSIPTISRTNGALLALFDQLDRQAHAHTCTGMQSLRSWRAVDPIMRVPLLATVLGSMPKSVAEWRSTSRLLSNPRPKIWLQDLPDSNVTFWQGEGAEKIALHLYCLSGFTEKCYINEAECGNNPHIGTSPTSQSGTWLAHRRASYSLRSTGSRTTSEPTDSYELSTFFLF